MKNIIVCWTFYLFLLGPYVLFLLKLFHLISWNWWIVGFSPLWGFFLCILFCFIQEIIKYIPNRRRVKNEKSIRN